MNIYVYINIYIYIYINNKNNKYIYIYIHSILYIISQGLLLFKKCSMGRAK